MSRTSPKKKGPESREARPGLHSTNAMEVELMNTHGTITAAPAGAINPYEEGPFRQIGDMEDHLATARDLLAGLAMIAETLDDAARVVQRMAWLAIEQIKVVGELRREAWRLTHPRRAHFDNVGWPS